MVARALGEPWWFHILQKNKCATLTLLVKLCANGFLACRLTQKYP